MNEDHKLHAAKRLEDLREAPKTVGDTPLEERLYGNAEDIYVDVLNKNKLIYHIEAPSVLRAQDWVLRQPNFKGRHYFICYYIEENLTRAYQCNGFKTGTRLVYQMSEDELHTCLSTGMIDRIFSERPPEHQLDLGHR